MLRFKKTIYAIVLTILFIIIVKPEVIFKETEIFSVNNFDNADVKGYNLDQNFLVKIEDGSFVNMDIKKKYDKVRIKYNNNTLEKDIEVRIAYSDREENYSRFSSIASVQNNVLEFGKNTTGTVYGDGFFRLEVGNEINDKIEITDIKFYQKKINLSILGVLEVLALFLINYFIIFTIDSCIDLCIGEKNITFRESYLWFILFGCVLFYVFLILSHGEIANQLFIRNTKDTYMDFFASLSNARYSNPYSQYSNYPALALLVYKLLFQVTPIYSYGSSGVDLQSLQMTQIIFIIYNIIIIGMIFYIIDKKTELSRREKSIVKILVIISAPFIFTLERGNIILLSLMLTMIFIFYHQSNKRYVQEIANIALALAAGIKIYPAIFGLLLIKEKKWNQLIKLVIYGMVAFLLPFCFFGGVEGIKVMVSALRTSSGDVSNLGYGCNVTFSSMLATICKLLDIKVNYNVINLFTGLVIAGLICVFYVSKNVHHSCLALTFLAVVVPGMSRFYTCVFFLIPFLFMLIDEKKFENKMNNILEMIFYIIIFVPLPLGVIRKLSRDYIYILSIGMVIQYICLIGMTIYLIITTGIGCYKKYREKFIEEDKSE